MYSADTWMLERKSLRQEFLLTQEMEMTQEGEGL